MLPAMLAVLYLVAWREVGDAEGIGMDRETFWLLLVGGSVGWIGNVPVFFWGSSIMAVNIGGAVIPIALSLYLMSRFFRPETRGGTVYVIGIWLEATILSVALLLSGLPGFWVLGVYGLAAVTLLPISTGGFRLTAGALATLLQYALLSVATVGTYFTTYVILDAGIVSPFPFVLLPPVAVAGISILALRGSGTAPGLAYATATLGSVVGADVLHQPELYAPGTGAFFGAIGGAGPLDLVFLSGLLAMALALLFLPLGRTLRPRNLRRQYPSTPNPMTRAISAFEEHRYRAIGAMALEGVQREAESARRLLNQGIPDTLSGEPVRFEEFHFHPAVQEDYDALTRVAVRGTPSRESSWRALVTGFFLKRALEEVVKRRLATPRQRANAFLFDLAVTVGPASAFLILFYRLMHLQGVGPALNNLSYQAVIYGAASYPVFVLSLSEWVAGLTPGKWLVGIEVVNRDLAKPGSLQALGRNVTKLVATTPLALGVGLALPYVADGGGQIALLTGMALVLTGLVTALVAGWVGIAVSATNPRQRRLGDLMVGTQVIQTFKAERPAGPVMVPSPLPISRA